MKNKINYLMSRDTRLVLDNLRKVIINENELLVNYTILKKDLKDEEIIVVNYIKDKNRMIIYDVLKKYNHSIIYDAFIEWAHEKGIEIFKQKIREEVEV